MIADKNVYRAPQALGPAYEHPELVSDDTIEQYLCPLVRNAQRTRDFQRFLAAFDSKHTLAIEDRLNTLRAPTRQTPRLAALAIKAAEVSGHYADVCALLRQYPDSVRSVQLQIWSPDQKVGEFQRSGG